MSRRQRLLRQLEAQWKSRFGEPPPIRTDPDLMRSILDAPASPDPVAGVAAEPPVL